MTHQGDDPCYLRETVVRRPPGMKEEDIAAGRTRGDLPGELSRWIDTPAESRESVTEV